MSEQPARWIRMHSTRTEVTATTPSNMLSPLCGPIEVHFEDDAGSVVTIDGDKRSLLRLATQIIEAAVIADARTAAIAADKMLRKMAEQAPLITDEEFRASFKIELPDDIAAKIQEGRVGGYSIGRVPIRDLLTPEEREQVRQDDIAHLRKHGHHDAADQIVQRGEAMKKTTEETP